MKPIVDIQSGQMISTPAQESQICGGNISIGEDATPCSFASPSPTQSSSSKQHSKEADELDFLCRKLTDIRVKNRQGISEEEIRLSDVSEEQFCNLVKQVSSPNTEVLRDTVVKFRKLLAHEDIHPYLERIVCSGVVPQFIRLLSHCLPELQFEAAWVLTNIAAGTSSQTAAIVNSNVIPPLIALLKSSFKEIREQSVWCLGNIAGDSADMRMAVLNGGALQPILDLIAEEMNEFLNCTAFHAETITHFPSTSSGNSHSSPSKTRLFNLSTLRISMWALSNICRGSGKSASLDWTLINIAMPVLSQVLTCCSPTSKHSDDEILMDACWALSRILRGIHEGVSDVIVKREVCATLGTLISYHNSEVQVPALRCLINVVSGGDAQTQEVIDSGILPHLHQILRSQVNDTIRKEACLIVSNITAGTKYQVQAVIETGIIPTLVEMLRTSDYRTKREAAWALGNAVLNRDPAHVEYIVNQGAIAPLVDMIAPNVITVSNDDRVILKILEACRNILTTGDSIAYDKSNSTNEVDCNMDTSEVIERLANVRLASCSSSEPTNKNHESPYNYPSKQRTDSAYSSLTNVFSASDNPFHAHFLKKSPSTGFSGYDGIRGIAIMQRRSHSRETILTASDILQTWFAIEEVSIATPLSVTS